MIRSLLAPLGIAAGLVLTTALPGAAVADFSDLTAQGVTIQYAGTYAGNTGPNNINVGVVQGVPILSTYRTLYLVTVPPQYQKSDLSITLQISSAYDYYPFGNDPSINPLPPLSPIHVSLVQGNPSAGESDPIQALANLLGITQPTPPNHELAYASAYNAPVVSDTTVTLTPTVSTTQYVLSKSDLQTPGVLETINGITYFAIKIEQDSLSKSDPSKAHLNATSELSLNVQPAPVTVPEPSALALVGGGLLLAAGRFLGRRVILARGR